MFIGFHWLLVLGSILACVAYSWVVTISIYNLFRRFGYDNITYARKLHKNFDVTQKSANPLHLLESSTRSTQALHVPNICSPTVVGGGYRTKLTGKFTSDEVLPWLVNSHDLDGLTTGTFEFEYQTQSLAGDEGVKKHELFISANIPFHVLVPKLTRDEGIATSKLHDIRIPKSTSAPRVREILTNHDCACVDLVCILRYYPAKEKRRARNVTNINSKLQIDTVQPGEKDTLVAKKRRSNDNKLLVARKKSTALVDYEAEQQHKSDLDTDARSDVVDSVNTPFPPDPLKPKDKHRILSAIGSSFAPTRFEETGCAVCGLLIPHYGGRSGSFPS